MTECTCPKCGADILTAGFTVQSVRYTVYRVNRARFQKVRGAKSTIDSARCICGESLKASPKEILGARAA